jgi:hypothetical protein
VPELTYEQKIDKLFYTVFGNGIPGISNRMEAMEMFMQEISIHHAKEPRMIEQAIETAFEKRFGKKNKSVTLFVAIASLAIAAFAMIISYLQYASMIEQLAKAVNP